MLITKYIESDDRIDIKERYIYDINLNRYEVVGKCTENAFASLFYNSDGNAYYHIYHQPLLSHVLGERTDKYYILCIRLRVKSYFNDKKLSKEYIKYKHAIISVSQ